MVYFFAVNLKEVFKLFIKSLKFKKIIIYNYEIKGNFYYFKIIY